MIVTRIESVTKTKFKVFLNEQFAFVLYKGELSRYQIQEGKELSQSLIDTIQTEVILKRAKLRAMHLLNAMDRTEEQLRMKLRQGLYTEDIIDKALQYVKSFGYVEDENYAVRYIRNRQNAKSRKELYAALCQKGVPREYIESAMDSCYEEMDEMEAIRRLVEKKRFSPEDSTDAEKKKMYDFLLRKGFRSEDIRQVIQVSSWNA
ncbi:MAG: regulatory protein RecX [Tyzzerella sp.]|nr:regulatory protein RecX [Tyzzerella sp.]